MFHFFVLAVELLNSAIEEIVERRRNDFWKLNEIVLKKISTFLKWTGLFFSLLFLSSSTIKHDIRQLNDLDRLDDMVEILSFYQIENQEQKCYDYEVKAIGKIVKHKI